MRYAPLVIAIISLIFALFVAIKVHRENNRTYPPAHTLVPDSNGIIHHPMYGDYPAEVGYVKGMTLHPGQSAGFTIELDVNDIEDFN